MIGKFFPLFMLMQRIEAKAKAAKADGVVDREEKIDLLISFLAGLVDLLSDFLPMDVIEGAFARADEIRDRVATYRGKAATALDRAAEAYDEILK